MRELLLATAVVILLVFFSLMPSVYTALYVWLLS